MILDTNLDDLQEDVPEQPAPTIRELHEQYKPTVLSAVMELSLIHIFAVEEDATAEKQAIKNRHTEEVEAESISYACLLYTSTTPKRPMQLFTPPI